jgi:hypothetical protein
VTTTRHRHALVGLFVIASFVAIIEQRPHGQSSTAAAIVPAAAKLPAPGADIVITETDCAPAKVGTTIPVSAIGEPVSAVTLSAPVWTPPTDALPALCVIDGSFAAVDQSPTARPINFRVSLPASWNRRAIHHGGGGMNGSIPALGASADLRGYARYGSDSGHQNAAGPGRRGAPAAAPPAGAQVAPPPTAGAQVAAAPGARPGGAPPGRGRASGPPTGSNAEWAVNDEAIRNLAYMQLKKTHDAAFVLIERLYGERPRFSYFVGSSQGGREGLTVAQRYPADYDGVLVSVPIVNFSTLMLAPSLIRIQERSSANWVTPAKVEAIRAEFMRQCDHLDGLIDGVMNNYVACRAIFDVSSGARNRHPWAAKRCPNNVDPNPADTTPAACLTDGQISTLEFVYKPYVFPAALAHGVTRFGMWVPTIEPSGSGLIERERFEGQEGAAADAVKHGHLGILGVTGFIQQNLSANPLDFTEAAFSQRRRQLSEWADATNPDLTAFYRRGGKLIATIGSQDTLASPGAQLDYYQSILDKMGRSTVDAFARLFVLPQGNHGLTATTASIDGSGKAIPVVRLPTTWDRMGALTNWVERKVAPGRAVTMTAGDQSLPLCSYPAYPKYTGGAVMQATSYVCSQP